MNAASQFLSQAELTEIARKIRVSIVSMLTAAGSGHTAGALGMVEIFTSLYFDRAKIDPQIQVGLIETTFCSPLDTPVLFSMPH